jgi:hypothetical protein
MTRSQPREGKSNKELFARLGFFSLFPLPPRPSLAFLMRKIYYQNALGVKLLVSSGITDYNFNLMVSDVAITGFQKS